MLLRNWTSSSRSDGAIRVVLQLPVAISIGISADKAPVWWTMLAPKFQTNRERCVSPTQCIYQSVGSRKSPALGCCYLRPNHDALLSSTASTTLQEVDKQHFWIEPRLSSLDHVPTTTSNSGLAIPTWPVCWNRLVPNLTYMTSLLEDSEPSCSANRKD